MLCTAYDITHSTVHPAGTSIAADVCKKYNDGAWCNPSSNILDKMLNWAAPRQEHKTEQIMTESTDDDSLIGITNHLVIFESDTS